jgi:c-di-GMP-binding flagellar brake protein YcgR
MKDNRKQPRKRVKETCYLIDTDREVSLGRVMNLSLGGMLAWCDQPIEDLTFFWCRLALPNKGEEPTVITFGARSMWCEQDVAFETWEVGFKFLSMSEKDKEFLSKYLTTWQGTFLHYTP